MTALIGAKVREKRLEMMHWLRAKSRLEDQSDPGPLETYEIVYGVDASPERLAALQMLEGLLTMHAQVTGRSRDDILAELEARLDHEDAEES